MDRRVYNYVRASVLGVLLLALQMSRDITSIRETMGTANHSIHNSNQAIGNLDPELAELRGRLT